MSLKEYPVQGEHIHTGQAADAGDQQQAGFAELPLNLLVASKSNPRTQFNAGKLQELADSIAASEVHQPILVRPLPPGRLQETSGMAPRPTHEVVSGERRFRASGMVGKATIPAMIRALTDGQVLEIQLIENLQRDDLTPYEEAVGYSRLVGETGIAKEDIGAKIGKSRTYVYARLKLLDLRQEARAALASGTIDFSRALAIARIPDHQLQAKALKEATGTNWAGDMPSYRAFQSWLHDNVMLRLDAARFKITDANLVPAAGACRDCSKRTGANPDLFADVNSADVCTDPACFHAKEEAHDAAAIALASERGQKLITGKEAKKIWPWEHSDLEGYVRLDKPDSRLSGNKTLSKVLGKDAPTPMLIQSPYNGELVAVLPADKVTTMLKDKGLITPRQAKATHTISAAEAKRTAVEKFERTWRKAAVTQVCDAMNHDTSSGLSAGVVRLLAAMLISGLTQDQRGHSCELLGLGKIANEDALHDHVKTCPEEMVERVCMLLLMQHDTMHIINYHSISGAASQAHRIEAVAADFAVDLDKVKAQAKEDLKPKAKAPPAKAVKTTKTKASAPAVAADAKPATGQNDLLIGMSVRFLADLKGAGGKVRKVCGRTGTVERKVGDGAVSVRFGKKAHEVANADWRELEIVLSTEQASAGIAAALQEIELEQTTP